ncbi:MAG: signal peptidase I [Acidimicrobiales bacterium]
MSSSERDPGNEPVVVISRRTLRRLAVVTLAVIVLAGVAVGAYFLGRTSTPSRSPATSEPTSTSGAGQDVVTVTVLGLNMSPTLTPQQSVEVDLSAYDSSPPQRGDIIGFRRPPADNCNPSQPHSSDLISRVIGLPGETISARSGQVYVNGQPLAEPWLPEQNAYTAAFGPVRIPTGDFFVMGDNRADSCDSRDWGPLPRSFILGRIRRG